MGIYEGHRYESHVLVSWRASASALESRPLPLYLTERSHSPDGAEWGYCGSGPAQLAYALLRHATGDADAAERLHQRYKQDVVANLPHDGWALWQEYILEWVTAQLAGPTV